MIYIVTIIVFVIFIFIFDLAKDADFAEDIDYADDVDLVDNGKKRGKFCYCLMTIWLIALSGFAYNVGSDIPGYMKEYDLFLVRKIESIYDIINFQINRQPLWVLLEYVCHSISPNFLLLKLVVSIVCNATISIFIFKHSKYPFIALLFYGFVFYLHINFNALRQSMAIAFFLMGYDSLVGKKWIKYYAFSLCAFLFHSSALICFFLPLIHFLKFNRKTILIFSGLLMVSVFVLLRIDVSEAAFEFLQNNDELIAENYWDWANNYINESTDTNVANLNGMIFIAFQIAVMIFIMFVVFRLYGTSNELMLNMLLVYTVLVILNRTIPVVFTRVMQFFDIFYCCLLPSAVVSVCRRITKNRLIVIVFLALFAILPISNLFVVNKQSGVPMIVQYNPYYSVFNPEIDPQRSMLFGFHE